MTKMWKLTHMKNAVPLASLGWLYLVQGIPYGLQDKFIPVQLRSLGLQYSSVSLLKILLVPWIAKGLWAPIVEVWGGRHRWLVCSLLALAGSSYAGSYIAPDDVMSIGCMLLALNIFSAVQDVAVDGLALQVLPQDQLGLGNTIQVVLYKVGCFVGGAGLTYLLAITNWTVTFIILAFIYFFTAVWATHLPNTSVMPGACCKPDMQEDGCFTNTLSKRERLAFPTKEGTGQDPTTKECTEQDPATKEGTGQDPATKEDTEQDPTTKEGTEQDPSKKEDTEQDPTTNEGTEQDPAKKEDTEQDPAIKEDTGQDPAMREGTEQDPAMKEDTGQDPATREGTEQDPAMKEDTGQDPATREGTEQDPATREGTEQDPATKLSMKSQGDSQAKQIFSILKEVIHTPGTLWLSVYVLLYKMGERGAINNMPLYLLDKGLSKQNLAFWNGTVCQGLSILGSFYGGIILLKPNVNIKTVLMKHSIYRLVSIMLQYLVIIFFEFFGNFNTSVVHSIGIVSLCSISYSSGVISTASFTLMMRVSRECSAETQASHYSALASIEIAGKLFFASFAGFIIDYAGMSWTFALFIILCTIPLIVLKAMPDQLCHLKQE